MDQSHRFPHRELLGWIYLVLGAAGLVHGGLTFFTILSYPAGGYALLPAFLLFVFLPFSLLCGLTGYTLLRHKAALRPLTLVLSLILLVFNVLVLVLGRTLLVFGYVPLPLMLALGVYGIVMAREV